MSRDFTIGDSVNISSTTWNWGKVTDIITPLGAYQINIVMCFTYNNIVKLKKKHKFATGPLDSDFPQFTDTDASDEVARLEVR